MKLWHTFGFFFYYYLCSDSLFKKAKWEVSCVLLMPWSWEPFQENASSFLCGVVIPHCLGYPEWIEFSVCLLRFGTLLLVFHSNVWQHFLWQCRLSEQVLGAGWDHGKCLPSQCSALVVFRYPHLFMIRGTSTWMIFPF